MPLELLLVALAVVAVFALIVAGLITARQRRRRALDVAPPWTPPDTTDPFAAWEDLFDPQSRRYHR